MTLQASHSTRLLTGAAICLFSVAATALAADNVTSSENATVFIVPASPAPTTLATHTGARMIWYPNKAAFRAGTVTGTQWDHGSIGTQSFAVGSNTTAGGTQSAAFGNGTTAYGYVATAFGVNSSASGYNGPFASGWSASASGMTAHALGYFAVASNSYALATGSNTLASGQSSTAMGANTKADGTNATSMGLGTIATAFSSTVIGQYNATETTSNSGSPVAGDFLFVVGNGTSSTVNGTTTTVRKNAVVVRKNGDMGVQGVLRVWPAGDVSMGAFTSDAGRPPAQ